MLLASLDTLTKGESELRDKINQLLASQSMVKASLFQMCMSCLKVTKCAPEETFLQQPLGSGCRRSDRGPYYKVG